MWDTLLGMRIEVGIAATLILRLLSQGKSEKSQSGPFLKGKREREAREYPRVETSANAGV